MKKPNLGEAERDRYGVTATFVQLDSRLAVVDMATVAFTNMTTMDGGRAAAAWCDRHEGDWRVRTLSSPVTIQRDMQGARMQRSPNGGYSNIMQDSSERHLLGRVGRLDLIELPARDVRRTANGRRRAAEKK